MAKCDKCKATNLNTAIFGEYMLCGPCWAAFRYGPTSMPYDRMTPEFNMYAMFFVGDCLDLVEKVIWRLDKWIVRLDLLLFAVSVTMIQYLLR